MTNAINITMPPELIEQIDRVAGKRGRSYWIVKQCRKALKLEEPADDNPPLAADADDYEPKPKQSPKVEKPSLRLVECINDRTTYNEKKCGPLAATGECVASGGICPYWNREQP